MTTLPSSMNLSLQPSSETTATLKEIPAPSATRVLVSLSLTRDGDQTNPTLLLDEAHGPYLDSLAEAVEQARALIAHRTAVPPEQQALLTREEVAAA